MHTSPLRICLALMAVITGLCAKSQDDDMYTRLNPELPQTVTVNPKVPGALPRYSFIDYAHNNIDMNGGDWTQLHDKLMQTAENATFTIVHIGDSHIQAEGSTSRIRQQMQATFGDAGRGLIAPLRIAGTNQPTDYRITSPDTFTKAKLMNIPWPTRMGFTGVSLRPATYRFSFTIDAPDQVDYLNIYCAGAPRVVSVTSQGKAIPFATEQREYGIDLDLDHEARNLTITLEGSDVNIYGFDLRRDSNGVVYHAIGNNGAAFASYNNIGGFGNSLTALDPDLVILSLGTNEAFGRPDDKVFYNQINTMVEAVRRANPDARILLVTPAECQRTVSHTTYSGKGRKRRAKRVKSYQVNTNVKRMRDVIVKYGRENHIPVYDFYQVAGGDGASAHWLDNKLLSTDRIHRTWAGYALDGQLTYEALMKALTQKQSR